MDKRSKAYEKLSERIRAFSDELAAGISGKISHEVELEIRKVFAIRHMVVRAEKRLSVDELARLEYLLSNVDRMYRDTIELRWMEGRERHARRRK